MTAHDLIQRFIPTLYEDDYLVAVDKPAGVDAGGGRQRSAAGIVELLGALRGAGEKFEVANRLGLHESGVLILGKAPEIVRHIRTGLRANRITQEYLAVVRAHVTKRQLTIESTHGASRGQQRGAGSSKTRRGAARNLARAGQPRGVSGTAADRQTVVRLVRQGRVNALVRCRTAVETTHSLRAQLRAAALRLAGDTLHERDRHRKPTDTVRLHLERFSFHHPHLKSKLTVRSPAPTSFAAVVEDKVDVGRPLLAALVKRLPLIMDPDIDSCRLMTGDAEGRKGLVAEKYDKVVILQIRAEDRKLAESLPAIARWYRGALGCQAVYAKRFPKNRSALDTAASDELRSPRPLLGKQVPSQIEIMEHGARLAVRPYDGFSVGLFLDHRDNRRRVSSMAEGKDVLNLFAYTCAFSVAAAVGGAVSTTSVDISSKHLQSGRANFALNNLDTAAHQCHTEHAADYLKRARRQNRTFDMIILDPPTFAHGSKRKKTFSVTEDLSTLISASLAVLRPGGVMMISTSHRQLTLSGLRERIEEGAGGRGYRITATPPLPIDFAMDRSHAKTLFARFE